MEFFFNILITSFLISFVLWISKINPILGGFIVSLPISTLIVLALSKIQNQNTENSFLLAKSIFIGIPSTLLFFVPFLLAPKFKFSFWSSYFIGLSLLFFGYFIHKWIIAKLI